MANDTLYTLLGRSSGDGVSASIADSHGTVVCGVSTDAGSCQLGAAGLYTLTVWLYSGGSGNYTISVESMRTPSSCSALADSFFSFASPGVARTLPTGSAGQCYAFDQPQGSVLYLSAPGGGDVQGPILDAQYQPVCFVRYAANCTLSRPGPYHLFLHEFYGNQAAYTLYLPRISNSVGCPAATAGPFGDQGSAVASGTVTSRIACHQLSVANPETVGVRFSQFEDQYLWWWIYDNAGRQVCEKYSNADGCPLSAAGQYTMVVLNQSWEPSLTYELGITNLSGSAGCGSATATNWDQPALVLHVTSPVQINCVPVTGRAGDRILTYVAPTAYNEARALLVDGSGTLVCTGYSSEDGCQLPADGTYRVLSYLRNWDSGSTDLTYKLQVRRLNEPIGCPTVTPGAYNAAPAGSLAGNRCRVLRIPAAGSYRIKPVDAGGYEAYGQIYDAAGIKVCTTQMCTFPAGGSYTLVLNGSVPSTVLDEDYKYALAVLPTVPFGCPQVSDDLGSLAAYQGQFGSPAQFDCVQLASPAGAKIMEVLPGNASGAGRPSVTVVDADGNYVCDSTYSLRQYSCELTGAAPFYAVMTGANGNPASSYTVSFPRVSGTNSCAVLPQGATGASITTSHDHFAACFSVPADQHGAKEVFTYTRTSGTGDAGFTVVDANGVVWCGYLGSPSINRSTTCTLPAGPVTVVLEADAVDATYQISHVAGA
ncbi:hypothetical protein HDA40_006034 [Hamadaea flava]|uniref:Uncharacterized protein n=1 Tax=Hamadaea flava TaxID=1742688 RepID=A0ABV8LW61_9ACTN|nr:hypothetical protein [Hamadaea flava]MCP2327527.1 hypothetical protein [Hamadaea flava]